MLIRIIHIQPVFNVCLIFFQIPRAVIEPVLFGSLIFIVAELRGGFVGWLGFCFVCVLCANYANAYGKMIIVTDQSYCRFNSKYK